MIGIGRSGRALSRALSLGDLITLTSLTANAPLLRWAFSTCCHLRRAREAWGRKEGGEPNAHRHRTVCACVCVWTRATRDPLSRGESG